MSNFVILEGRSVELVAVPSSTGARYSIDAAAQLAAVHPDMVRYYFRRGMLGTLGAGSEAEHSLDDDALYELRRIEHFRRRFGLNRRALLLLSRLLRDVERLEDEIRFHRSP